MRIARPVHREAPVPEVSPWRNQGEEYGVMLWTIEGCRLGRRWRWSSKIVTGLIVGYWPYNLPYNILVSCYNITYYLYLKSVTLIHKLSIVSKIRVKFVKKTLEVLFLFFWNYVVNYSSFIETINNVTTKQSNLTRETTRGRVFAVRTVLSRPQSITLKIICVSYRKNDQSPASRGEPFQLSMWPSLPLTDCLDTSPPPSLAFSLPPSPCAGVSLSLCLSLSCSMFQTPFHFSFSHSPACTSNSAPPCNYSNTSSRPSHWLPKVYFIQ